MIVEKTVYEGEGIRIFTEEEHPSKDDHQSSHRCTCGRSVCCGKHKGCAKAMNDKKLRFKKGRTY